MATKLQNFTGTDLSVDRADQTSKKLYIGDPKETAAEADAAGSLVALTNGFRDANQISGADAVIDMLNYDTLVVEVDYRKGGGTGLRLKATFGDVDDRTRLTMQEMREDNGFTGVVRHENLEHEFLADFRGLVCIPRLCRYVKMEVKSLGTPDASSKVGLAYFGQNREGR